MTYDNILTALKNACIHISLSLKNGEDKNENLIMHWTAWSLSLLLGLLNGYISFYKVDKKYFHLNSILEELKREGWKYVQLTDKYTKNHGTHYSGFLKFCKEFSKDFEKDFSKID